MENIVLLLCSLRYYDPLYCYHVAGLDGSLVEDDGSLDYMSGLSNSSSAGLNAQGNSATPVTSLSAASVAATPLVSGGGGGGGAGAGGGGGGSGGTTGDYYGYDYDSRTYRLPSTLVGRNYLYPPSSVPLNQVRKATTS